MSPFPKFNQIPNEPSGPTPPGPGAGPAFAALTAEAAGDDSPFPKGVPGSPSPFPAASVSDGAGGKAVKFKKQSPWVTVLKILLTLAIFFIAGIAVYLMFLQPKDNAPDPGATNSSQTQTTDQSTADADETATDGADPSAQADQTADDAGTPGDTGEVPAEDGTAG